MSCALHTLTIVVLGLVAVPAFGQTRNNKKPAPKTFPDFGNIAPNYVGRAFALSQRYPEQLPENDVRPAFMSHDFRTDWRSYLMGARDYCFEGNILGGHLEDDFRVGEYERPKWFHMPWQHYDVTGREGLHGLTREAPIKSGQLAATQVTAGYTYAVAFFNPAAAVTIHSVWGAGFDEAPRNLKKIIFAEGSVCFKLLFSSVTDPAEVPYLTNAVLWNAYITDAVQSSKRVFAPVALIQMDVMVRDERSPTKWVFGTFQYNGAFGRCNRWENLVPVGLQWGNDPDQRDDVPNTFPAATRRNEALTETKINQRDEELPPTRLGWNGRLNGPVDNASSSCISCHMTAQALQRTPLTPEFQAHAPKPGDDEWMRWFRNLKPGDRFDARSHDPTDFSLQLAQSIQNYEKWRRSSFGFQAGQFLPERKRAATSAEAGDQKFTETILRQDGTIDPQPVYKDQRGF